MKKNQKNAAEKTKKTSDEGTCITNWSGALDKEVSSLPNYGMSIIFHLNEAAKCVIKVVPQKGESVTKRRNVMEL